MATRAKFLKKFQPWRSNQWRIKMFYPSNGKILVKENGFALFEAVADGLEIEIEEVSDLPVMNEVRVHMEQFG